MKRARESAISFVKRVPVRLFCVEEAARTRNGSREDSDITGEARDRRTGWRATLARIVVTTQQTDTGRGASQAN